MYYLRYLCLFGSSLPPVVCRRVYVLFTLFVFVRFVFTSSCLQEGLCIIYVICVCLPIMVSNTYCIVFLFCFPSSGVLMLPVSLDCPSVFSNRLFVFLRLVYSMLPVSLDCPSLIDPCLQYSLTFICFPSSGVLYVASFSGLSFFD